MLKKALIIFGAIILSFIGLLALPWLLLAIGLFMLPAPPKPAIKHGEFPFVLEYEINGQHKVLKDTLICDFAGYNVDEGRGKTRKWKSRLASGNVNVILLQINNQQAITFSPVSESYYMGDESYYKGDDGTPSYVILLEATDANGHGASYISKEDLENTYHIKVTHWESAKPITNTFK